MRLLFNENIYGYRMTGLLGKGGKWFIGFSTQPPEAAPNEHGESTFTSAPVDVEIARDLADVREVAERFYMDEIDACKDSYTQGILNRRPTGKLAVSMFVHGYRHALEYTHNQLLKKREELYGIPRNAPMDQVRVTATTEAPGCS